MHHPTDIAAGQLLAEKLFVELKRSDAFKAALKATRRSLK